MTPYDKTKQNNACHSKYWRHNQACITLRNCCVHRNKKRRVREVPRVWSHECGRNRPVGGWMERRLDRLEGNWVRDRNKRCRALLIVLFLIAEWIHCVPDAKGNGRDGCWPWPAEIRVVICYQTQRRATTMKKTQSHSQMSMQFLDDICGGVEACFLLTDDKESAKKLQARCSVIEGFFPKTPTA